MPQPLACRVLLQCPGLKLPLSGSMGMTIQSVHGLTLISQTFPWKKNKKQKLSSKENCDFMNWSDKPVNPPFIEKNEACDDEPNHCQLVPEDTDLCSFSCRQWGRRAEGKGTKRSHRPLQASRVTALGLFPTHSPGVESKGVEQISQDLRPALILHDTRVVCTCYYTFFKMHWTCTPRGNPVGSGW